jgi:hypothetical protein
MTSCMGADHGPNPIGGTCAHTPASIGGSAPNGTTQTPDRRHRGWAAEVVCWSEPLLRHGNTSRSSGVRRDDAGLGTVTRTEPGIWTRPARGVV